MGTAETEELIAVRMSPTAAAALAKACRWASYEASNLLEDSSLLTTRREKAEEANEWLSWGATWLVNEEAREMVADKED